MLCAGWMMVWRSSLDGVFHFDDYGNIVDNERIRQLWPLGNFLQHNRPVGLYSFAINYHFSGLDPFAYHVTNLVIHLANGLMLFAGCLLTDRLYRRYWCDESEPQVTYSSLGTAALIATVWCVHPLTTQAVTNIVQRYESLASMGYLGVWLGMLVYMDGRKVLGCVVILPMAWIGLMSKEVFATAPLAVVLLDRLLTKQSWPALLRSRTVPIGLMLSPLLWFLPSVSRFFDTSKPGGSMGFGMETMSAWEYLRTQPEVIGNYVGRTLWPQNLCFDYVWRIQDNPWVYLPLGVVILGVLGAASYAYVCGAIQKRSFAAGLAGWMTLKFFFILAPTCSVVPIADLAVEHRAYLACAIILAGIVLLAKQLASHLLRSSVQPMVLRTGLACIVFAVVGLLAWRTHLRNLDYRHGLTLWQSALDASPKNPRAWYNVGREYYQLGDKAKALPMMTNAVGFSNSSVPMFDAGLADCLHHVGRVDDAITLYRRALSKKPDYEEVLNHLGVIYLDRQQIELARENFQAAADLGHPEAIYNLGWLHFKDEQFEAAAVYFKRAVEINPDLQIAIRRLAWIDANVKNDKPVIEAAKR